MLWFTADTHFGHTNIIKHCARPFATVEEMDERIIECWNRVVKPGDEVWHLGDFAFRCKQDPVQYLRRLNGQIHIVWGNHDDDCAWKIRDRFASHHDYCYIRRHGQKIALFHYPINNWRASCHGSWQLFGHCHGTYSPTSKSMDVGVDPRGFSPVSFDEVKILLERIHIPCDHLDLSGVEEDNERTGS